MTGLTATTTPDAPVAAPPLTARVELRMGLAFWVVVCLVTLVMWSRGDADPLRGLLPYAAPVVALLVAWPWFRRLRCAGFVLDWLPLPLVVLTYEMLHRVVPACWTGTIDDVLVAADAALIGGPVAAWFKGLTHPAITTSMAVFYALYYVMPVSLGVWLRSRNRVAFRELMVGETGALFIGYLGYLFLPAIGPHAYAADFSPLEGDFIGAWIRSLNEGFGGHFPRDAFPSLHTANAVTILLVCARHDRRALRVFLPFVTGLVLATMYLHFHYFVDVVAGAALAIAWQRIVPRLLRGEAGSSTYNPQPAEQPSAPSNDGTRP